MEILLPPLGEPIASESTKGSLKKIQGSDSSDNFLPSKLENPAKCNHDMPLTPTTQTTLNVGFAITCSECSKPGLVYAKKKLSHRNAMLMQRILNDLQYVCSTIFHNIPVDDRNIDSLVLLGLLHCREILHCELTFEVPY